MRVKLDIDLDFDGEQYEYGIQDGPAAESRFEEQVAIAIDEVLFRACGGHIAHLGHFRVLGVTAEVRP